MRRTQIDQLGARCVAELKTLMRERAELDNKILGLHTVLKGLGYMQGKSPPEQEFASRRSLELHSAKPTDAVRLVLREATGALQPRQVRDRLLASGYSKLPESNPMAAIHGILQRLAKAGEAAASRTKEGKAIYRLRTDLERALQDVSSVGLAGVTRGGSRERK